MTTTHIENQALALLQSRTLALFLSCLPADPSRPSIPMSWYVVQINSAAELWHFRVKVVFRLKFSKRTEHSTAKGAAYLLLAYQSA